MSKERKVLEEAIAVRMVNLAGIGHINEEAEGINIEELYEPVEGVAAGGENLVQPIDHTKVVSDESNVEGIEVLDLHTGDVEVSDIQEIAESVRRQIASESDTKLD